MRRQKNNKVKPTTTTSNIWPSSYITEDLHDVISKPTALIIIDMQNDFIAKKGKIAVAYGLKAYSVVPKIKQVLDLFHRVAYPVVFTRNVYRPDYSDAGRRSRSRFLGALKEGSWGAEIVNGLKPIQTDYVICKQRESAFYQTNLDMILKSLKIESLVLTGVATNVCVESTARDALFRDYDCIILSDCVDAKNPQIQKASLRFMNEFTGLVTTSEELLKTISNLEDKRELRNKIASF